MTEEIHEIRVKSLQEWGTRFEADMIDVPGQMDMDFTEEISISFTCECGERFYKRQTAEEHLLEND